MRFVPLKEIWQQELQAIHRARSLMVAQRVAMANALRAFLSEQGLVCSSGEKPIYAMVKEILSDEIKFSGIFRDLLIRLMNHIQLLQKEIDHLEKQIKKFADTDDRCKRIQEINGVGPITACAIVATIGNANNFKNGRHFSAFLGLVPKQNSSGGKEKLLGTSKRGDGYLRSLLIHGARAVLQYSAKRDDYRSKWVTKKALERGNNKATVALANRNARVIWALLAKNETYKPLEIAA
jgi:transposase